MKFSLSLLLVSLAAFGSSQAQPIQGSSDVAHIAARHELNSFNNFFGSRRANDPTTGGNPAGGEVVVFEGASPTSAGGSPGDSVQRAIATSAGRSPGNSVRAIPTQVVRQAAQARASPPPTSGAGTNVVEPDGPRAGGCRREVESDPGSEGGSGEGHYRRSDPGSEGGSGEGVQTGRRGYGC